MRITKKNKMPEILNKNKELVTVQVPEKNGEYKEQTVQVTLGEAAK